MFRQVGWRVGFVATMVVALLITAQPVLAYKKVSQSGTVGHYELTDNKFEGYGGASCEYKPGPGTLDTLVGIWVSAPELQAMPGMGKQKMGWRYTIQRKMQGKAWQDRVSSKIFTKSSKSWVFGFNVAKRRKVKVPNGPAGPSASYRVLVSAYWYSANGKKVVGKITWRYEWYDKEDKQGNYLGHVKGSCFDYDM